MPNVGQGSAPLQFTTDGGQVLRFEPSSLMVASMDHLLRVDLVGANPVRPVSPGGASETSPSSGTSQPFTAITYPEAWEGVTVVYEAKAGAAVKSSYYVAGDLDGHPTDQIRLRYNRPVLLDAQGNLVIAYDHGTMTDSAPVAWQVIDGRRQPVEVHYVLHGDNEVGFTVGEYDPSRQLVIDPTLTWNAFLGGGGDDFAYALTVDGGGNVYMAGYSTATWGSPVRSYSSGNDIFVAKLGSSGGLVWNTFLGGSGSDRAFGITVDGSGNAYVTGQSNADWGSPVRAFGGGVDAFAAKLNSSGTLTWNTFLGGAGSDYGYGVALDSSGNVYLAGNSTVGWGSPVRAYTTNVDAFAVKLNSSGTLTWNTFLGGTGSDGSRSVAVDGSGNVYVAGYSSANWGSPVRAYSSSFDMMAAKLNSSGGLTWHTFLGGSGYEAAEGGVLDAAGNFYLIGRGDTNWGSPVQGDSGGTFDALAVKVDSSGGLVWNTFAGGSGVDYGNGIAVTGGSLYMVGSSDAAWGSPWRAFSSGTEGYVAEFNTGNGSRLTHGFLGGSGSDVVQDVAADASGGLFVAGQSNATWGSPLRSYSSGYEAFVAKIALDGSGYTISGRLFEDADFAGTASAYDGGVNDLALANVDVELYDGADAYIGSTVTAGDGSYSFPNLADGTYKVRVRSVTIGDADTPPAGGLNASVPGTWPYPLPEMAWGNGAALYGGQNSSVDDADTGDDLGPGDTFVTVTVSGGEVTGVNLGFAYNLIVTAKDDGLADNARSDQGSLRQFLKNANAIGTAGGTTANTSQFRIQMAANQSSGPDSWWRISPTSALPAIAANSAIIDGFTQAANLGDVNTRGPEIEINGAIIPTAAGLTLTSADGWIRGIVVNGFTTAPGAGILVDGASAIGNRITGCYIGTNAVGDGEDPNFYGIILSNGASGTVIGEAGEGNVISGSDFYGIEFDDAGANTTIRGNRIGTNAVGDAVLANAQGLYINGGNAIVIGGPGPGEGNLISGHVLYGINIQAATDVTIMGNWMGLNQAGTDPLPDGGTAIFGGGSSNDVTIGGPALGEGNIIAGNDGNGIAFQQGCNNWVIQGNTIGTGPLGTETNLGNTGTANIRVTTNDITINAKIGGENPGEGNLIAFASGPGIDCVSLGSEVEIIGNVIRDNGEEGIVTRVDNMTVAGNAIYDNGPGFDNIFIMVDAADGKWYQNTIHGSGDDGIEVTGLGHEIRNNIITGSAGYGINVNAGTMTESNNLVTGTVTSPANALGQSNVALDATDLNADPLYINAAGGDFALTECSSPAINTGLDLGAEQPDLNGNDPGNYNGSDPDRGAFETACVASTYLISGTVFEDANFAGTAFEYDGGIADAPLANVDVELYDSLDAYLTSVTTAVGGTYTFTGLSDDSYKVRVRSVTIGDTDTPPLGTLNPTVPGNWPYPLAEMTWGNGAPLYGGQNPTLDDAATGDNLGPGDTYAVVTVSGANVSGVNLGFAYNLIVNTQDDGLGNTLRSDQGSLRQFLKNANAIGSANGTTANSSEFRMQVTTNQSDLTDSWWRVTAAAGLPSIADSGTVLDGSTQRDNAGTDSNSRGPEIEIFGNGVGVIGLRIDNASNARIQELVVNGFNSYGVAVTGAAGASNEIFGCYVGTDAIGESAVANTNSGVLLDTSTSGNDVGGINPGEGNLISGNGGQGIQILSSGGNRVRGNRIGTDRSITSKIPNGGNGIYANGTSAGNTIGGATAAAGNTVSGNNNAGIWADFGQTNLTIQGNTVGTDPTGASTTLGNGYTGIRVSVASAAANVLVGGEGSGEGNQVAHNGQQGLYTVNAGTGVQFIGNTVRDNGFGGIYSRTDGVVLAMNLVFDNGAGYPGIRIADEFGSAADNNELYHNTVHGNGSDGVLIEGAGAILINNVITGNAGFGVNLIGTMAESYNDVTDGLTNPPNASGRCNFALDGSDLNADPIFVAAATGDFRLTECTSPAVNAGLDLGANQPDLNGSDPGAYTGPAPDLGALETSCLLVAYNVLGTVFEDADFAGTPSAYDGGVNDLALANVDVELYDGADAYVASTVTAGDGSYSFTDLAEGNYKVRARSATIGDTDTPPTGGFNATVPGAWPYPLAEMTWGNGSALIGGQDPQVDDSATGNDAGPGDTYVAVTVSGGDVSSVNFGFNYELIVNEDDDANLDNIRSKQGTLRQFIKNSNAIVGVNKSWFQIPSP